MGRRDGAAARGRGRGPGRGHYARPAADRHGADLDDRDALELVRERLRDARVLIVLDGAEHLLPDLAEVARQLAMPEPE